MADRPSGGNARISGQCDNAPPARSQYARHYHAERSSALTITARPTPNAAPARLKIRKNIDALGAQELTDLRRAIAQSIALKDKRSYEYFAGWHGVPLGWCQHHDTLFLPWHRAYLYWLELALQSEVPGVTLPWWDWSNSATIPEPYTVAQADGSENILAKAPITVFNADRQSGWPTETSRDPGEIANTPTPPYQQEWAYAMQADNYADFNQRIWTVHDTVHVWVGGTMGQLDWAAYDPVFFAHHANIDRAWRIWQAAHPGANPPADVLDVSLQTDPALTVQAVLDVTRLGYEYAGTQSTVPGSA
jgi:tyrosinase